MMTAGFIWASSQRSPALDQIDNQHHDRNDEQDVNQARRNLEGQTENPKDEQEHDERPEHAETSALEFAMDVPTVN